MEDNFEKEKVDMSPPQNLLEEMSNLFREELVRKEEKRKKFLGDDFKVDLNPPKSLFEDLSKLMKPPKKKRVVEEQVVEVEQIVEEPKEDQPLGLISSPPSTKTTDPLTPLNQNFVTKREMEDHYKTFLNRIQQQLSTLGGGGEANITFLDTPTTIVNSSSYEVKTKDYYIGVNYAGVVTITLPKPTDGKRIVVKDESGQASWNNRHIRIVPFSSSDTIDNQDAAIIQIDNGSLTFIYRGGWRII